MVKIIIAEGESLVLRFSLSPLRPLRLEHLNFLCSAYGVTKTRKTKMAMQAMFCISEAARRRIASLE
jgi:hypothetical protein